MTPTSTPIRTLEPAVARHSVLFSALSTNQKNWYAQWLADAIYRKGWQRLIPRRPNDNQPTLKAVAGGVIPKPRLAEVRAPEHEKAMVPEARLYIGFYGYQEALAELTDEEWNGWWNWLAPRRDKWGRPVTSPALYRSQGSRVVPNSEHTNRGEQRAARKLLAYAWIDLLEG